MPIRRPLPLALAAAALVLGAAGRVGAQDPSQDLPDGPGRDLVVRACTSCHDASQITYKRRTPEDWDYVITKMMQGGAELTAQEQDAVLAYLVKTLGVPAAAAPAPDAAPAPSKPPP